ncbi:binding-protein-dependent transport systems inner membrane component [Candidatus Moduliflexus flocculans]|uniref:Binding-protein-dependent transport systems inner membrane component n=1 Tax=Candidatus Moduliflexus flocculans TaxID=1499966 RepID=A0A081BMM3_9BACT|nr:binding-protein-dependent transport systems inner membrane component [Candidatus Moduliflexus flocculans]
MKTLQEQSAALRDLYQRQKAVETDIAAESQELAAGDAVYAASQWQLIWRKFKRNRAAIIGGIVILLFYLAAIFADFLSPYTVEERLTQYSYMPPQPVHFFNQGKLGLFVYKMKTGRDPKTLKKVFETDKSVAIPIKFFHRGKPYKLMGLFPTNMHLFGVQEGPVCLLGTDGQGRDMLSRVLIGSQLSLSVGLIGVFLSLLLGAVLGIASGYYGGWIDDLIQRAIEVVRSFPSIPLWMALTAALPAHWPPVRTYFTITIILSLIGWTWLARQLRGKVLALREEDFVMAARLLGASDVWVIFKHLIPATFSHIIVIATLSMPAMILAESSLSFLGLGLRPPLTSWGVLLKEAQNIQSLVLYPWLLLPGAFVAVSILAFNFLGDGLRDAADPYTV